MNTQSDSGMPNQEVITTISAESGAALGEERVAAGRHGRGTRRAVASPRRLSVVMGLTVAVVVLGLAGGFTLATAHQTASVPPQSVAALVPADIAAQPAGAQNSRGVATALSPLPGAPLTVLQVLGKFSGLKQPKQAVRLTSGDYAVVDPQQARVVLLNSAGRYVRDLHPAHGPWRAPVSVVATGHGLFVLDGGGSTGLGFIEFINSTGTSVRHVMSDYALGDARALAIDAKGQFYIADPRSNSVLVMSSSGKLLHQFTSARAGSGPDQYSQPSDVAVTSSGKILVLDNGNNRIKEITPAGKFVKQWLVTGSDTSHSVHMLPLADGRLIATYPGGALLLYVAGKTQPTLYPLGTPEQHLGAIWPLDVTTLPGKRLLVTDGDGNRLLVVHMP